MTAKFYKFSGDKDSLTKAFDAQSAELTLSAYQPLSQLEGSIIVSPTYENYNMIKIDFASKSKYYFIVGKTVDTAGRLHLRLFEDVLLTWADWIKKQKALILRAFAAGNDFLPANYPALAYSKISHHSSSSLDYGSATAAPDFVLVTAGRGYEAQSIKDAMTTSIPVN